MGPLMGSWADFSPAVIHWTPAAQEEALSQRSQLEALFTKDTVDAYRVFDTIEHFLCQPEYLRGQIQVQLGYATQVSQQLTPTGLFCFTPQVMWSRVNPEPSHGNSGQCGIPNFPQATRRHHSRDL